LSEESGQRDRIDYSRQYICLPAGGRNNVTHSNECCYQVQTQSPATSEPPRDCIGLNRSPNNPPGRKPSQKPDELRKSRVQREFNANAEQGKNKQPPPLEADPPRQSISHRRYRALPAGFFFVTSTC